MTINTISKFTPDTIQRIKQTEKETDKEFCCGNYENTLFIDESYIDFSGMKHTPYIDNENKTFYESMINSYRSYPKSLKAVGIGIGKVVNDNSIEYVESDGFGCMLDMLFCDGFVSYNFLKSNKHEKHNQWKIVGDMAATSLIRILKGYQKGNPLDVHVCSQSMRYVAKSLGKKTRRIKLNEINGGSELNLRNTFEYALKKEVGIHTQRRLWIDLDKRIRERMVNDKEIYSIRYEKPMKEQELLETIKNNGSLEPLPPII